MRVKDIVVDGYYAIAPSSYGLERYGRRGQVTAQVNRNTWRVRFRNPMVDDGWRLRTDKARGTHELELGISYFHSTWDAFSQEKKLRQTRAVQLAREIADLEGALDELRKLLKTSGTKLKDFEYIGIAMDWIDDERIATAALTLSYDTVLALIEAIGMVDTTEGSSVVDELLGKN